MASKLLPPPLHTHTHACTHTLTPSLTLLSLSHFLFLCVPTGLLVGCYESTRFKSKAKPPKLKELALLGLGGGGEEAAEAAVAEGAAVAAGNILTR